MRTSNVPPRVPVVLPLIDVAIDPDGAATVTTNGAPYEERVPVTRTSLAEVFEEIAAQHGPVRVHVTESDGSEFTDVVVPNPTNAEAPATPISSRSGFAGNGFKPLEDIDVAIVVAQQKADAEGRAELRIPPVLAGRKCIVLLLGRTSGACSVCEST